MKAFKVVKPQISVVVLIFFGMLPQIVLIALVMNIPWDDLRVVLFLLTLLVITISCFLFCFNYCIIRRIVITESGLDYHTLNKNVHRSWDEIKNIEVCDYRGRQREKTHFSLWIYFYEECPDMASANTKVFLKVHYRKEIINEISKYYIIKEKEDNY
jgi:hypothetical protein